MHFDLTQQSTEVGGTSRSFAMIATDPTTVVSILAADAKGVSGLANGVVITQLTAQNPKVQVVDTSTYVYYVVTQGMAPSSIWMDAI